MDQLHSKFPGVIQDAYHPGGHGCLEKQDSHCRLSKNDADPASVWNSMELKI